MRIAIAVFEDAEELDFAGPWEVLAAWSSLYPDDVEVALRVHALELAARLGATVEVRVEVALLDALVVRIVGRHGLET